MPTYCLENDSSGRTPIRKLLLSIARCPAIKRIIELENSENKCSKIVLNQKASLLKFRLPEPWSGHLDRACVLFLSSNPSISSNEESPLWSWEDNLVEDYFVHRFAGGKKAWSEDGIRHLRSGGGYGSRKEWVRHWAAVKRRCSELYPKGYKIEPGTSYVISEVVHCKSKEEAHVKDALKPCTSNYLYDLVACSAARIVVCMGGYAKQAVCDVFDFNPKDARLYPKLINGIEKWFAFLPHTNFRGPRTFERVMPKELPVLRSALLDCLSQDRK